MCYYILLKELGYVTCQGDADIFFPTDFWLLEKIDHDCSGFSKQQKNPGAFKPVKTRRTIIVSSDYLSQFCKFILHHIIYKLRCTDEYDVICQLSLA